jgi:hypothetical protein
MPIEPYCFCLQRAGGYAKIKKNTISIEEELSWLNVSVLSTLNLYKKLQKLVVVANAKHLANLLVKQAVQ